jgi:hypothetical protein
MVKAKINSYIDPNTGEKVSKCIIPEFHQKEIEKAIGDHQRVMNDFMGISQQMAEIMLRFTTQKQAINKSDLSIRDKMKFACKKSGLQASDPWTYNMQEKLFEMREAPDIKPLTGSEIPREEQPVG